MGVPFERERDGHRFEGSTSDYKNRAYTFLITLCNDRDMAKARSFLDEGCVLIHADAPPVRGADAFIDAWSKILESMPAYHKDIRDIIVEKNDSEPNLVRVWVYSQIIGIRNPSLTDSIDMMHFSANGLFVDSKDVQRDIAT